MKDLVQKQMIFSSGAFGPGTRRKGIVAHIRKELEELENSPDDQQPAKEWVDIIILGIDGLWRELVYGMQAVDVAKVPGRAVQMILQKIMVNEARRWPDWRGKSEDEPIEHDRG